MNQYRDIRYDTIYRAIAKELVPVEFGLYAVLAIHCVNRCDLYLFLCFLSVYTQYLWPISPISPISLMQCFYRQQLSHYSQAGMMSPRVDV